MDFDLAILGKDKLGYEEYSKNIRREYIHYPEESYRTGRSKVLQQLLAGKLFVTSDFIEGFENAARENIKEEIRNLGSPSYSLL